MRPLIALAVAGLLAVPAVSHAQVLNETAKQRSDAQKKAAPPPPQPPMAASKAASTPAAAQKDGKGYAKGQGKGQGKKKGYYGKAAEKKKSAQP